MPAASRVVGFLLAAILVVLAGIFGYRQWADRARRGREMSDEDHVHYARQDSRRFAGSVLMVLTALAMAFGLAINPRASLDHARLWILVWFGVLGMVCVMVMLAFLDWIAIQSFAVRHRRALAQERLDALEAERERLVGRRPPSAEPGVDQPSS
jgi:hypothetical protein